MRKLMRGHRTVLKTSSPSGRMLTSILLMLSSLFYTSWSQATAPGSVGFWYAPHPPLPELAQFDWVVVEPAHLRPADVAELARQGSLPFAYLSIGELDQHQAETFPHLLQTAASTARNEVWNSQVMDLTQAAWREHLYAQARWLEQQGYVGLFLDTLDSFTLLPAAEHQGQRDALVELLRGLHQRVPGLKLFFNRGFEVIEELDGLVAAVAAESVYAGWDGAAGAYREIPAQDRDWLQAQFEPIRSRGTPIVAIEYLPPARRNEARQLASRLVAEGYIPFISTPDLDSLGLSSIEVQPRRIALIFDPREGTLSQSPGHLALGGLLEYLGYRIDYLPADGSLPLTGSAGLYAGAVVWMSSGAPADSGNFNAWLGARLDEKVPLAIFAGLPVDDMALLKRLGLRRGSGEVRSGGRLVDHDTTLLGGFEAPIRSRTRGMLAVTVREGGPTVRARVEDAAGQSYTPVVIGDWGGMALAPYVFEEGGEGRRWILDPFAFLQQSLRLPPIPAPDLTTENGRRIATVHIDGDGFPSRAEIPGTPFAAKKVLDAFINPYPLLTSVSVIEGEISPRGMFPFLASELEPLARTIFAHDRVEVATHSYSHPFFWQPERASQREGFTADYGLHMAIPGYDKLDMRREIIGSRDYINSRLTTPAKPVKLMFWTGDAVPDAETVRLAYEAGLMNVNGGQTKLTNAEPSLTGLYPLLRPTAGGLHVYAPIINENVYTNLWHGPFYGFRDLIETFQLTDKPRRFRGLHLYYHFYAGTKQASIRAMDDIYRHMLEQQPISLWMSDYLQRAPGMHAASLAKTPDGAWQVKALHGLRTLRLDPALGWPDMHRSRNVAGVRDLPQGRYVHLSGDSALLVTRQERDSAPTLEEANVPLQAWDYLPDGRVRFSFAGEFPVQFSVRSRAGCRVEVGGQRQSGRKVNDLWYFKLESRQVSNALLICN